MTELARIRNVAIIAHIDHGKSTLADRLIERCGGLQKREMTSQVLDSMEIERERGITIKAQTVRLVHRGADGSEYVINLVDTPGHVDFSYEVSRSLAACEGSLLVVDATQGVEAQTLANAYQAVDRDHEIVPVLNKMDLASAEPDRVKRQIEEVIGIDASGALEISAKTGLGIDTLLDALIARLPPPAGDAKAPLSALLVDSWYDPYLGVVILVRILHGRLTPRMKIRMMASGAEHEVERVGVFTPKKTLVDSLGPGEIGFITAAIKDVADCDVGDTITAVRRPAAAALPGFRPSVPVVFCGLFPVDSGDYERLRESLAKLRLNDSSFHYDAESSPALGFGFRCGFLGLLHLEIVQERLEREFDLDLVATAPSVVYRVTLTDGRELSLHNPAGHARPLPDRPYRRALDSRHDPGSRPAPGRGARALRGEARHPARPHLCGKPGDGDLSAAAQRGRLRFLRPPEVGLARLCELRLPAGGLPRERSGEALHRDQRRARGRAGADRPQEPGPRSAAGRSASASRS